jgi:hypothetical protein
MAKNEPKSFISKTKKFNDGRLVPVVHEKLHAFLKNKP